MNRAEKYIEFEEAPDRGTLTKLWIVKARGVEVGTIRWYGGWRKYVVEYKAGTFSDPDGLRLAADFCEARTREHMQRRKKVVY